jgi:hypothetical protein
MRWPNDRHYCETSESSSSFCLDRNIEDLLGERHVVVTGKRHSSSSESHYMFWLTGLNVQVRSEVPHLSNCVVHEEKMSLLFVVIE